MVNTLVRRHGHRELARTRGGRLLTGEVGTIGAALADLWEVTVMERIKLEEKDTFKEMNELEWREKQRDQEERKVLEVLGSN